MNKAYRMLEQVKQHIPFETNIRISRRGVPHLLFSAPDGITYSICYFGRRKNRKRKKFFKIFYPYLNFSQQEKVICKLWTDVLKFFNFF